MKNLSQFFKALSEETRLKIIALLIWKEELCVCDIENVLELTQSKASRHLRYLLNSGILTYERKNVWVYYKLNENLPDEMSSFLDAFKEMINNETWNDLKKKLDDWIENKSSNDSCSA